MRDSGIEPKNPPSDNSSEDTFPYEEYYEIEAIVGHSFDTIKRTFMFQVKWIGYDSE